MTQKVITVKLAILIIKVLVMTTVIKLMTEVISTHSRFFKSSFL